jgi:DNA-binding transcriptional ArsR family regulator
MRTGGTRLSEDMIEIVAQRFRVLGEPLRLRILRALEEGEQSVSQLVETLDAGQSNVSRHLNALYEVGLLSRRREGINIYYGVGDPLVFKLCDLVCTSAREQMRQRLKAVTRADR